MAYKKSRPAPKRQREKFVKKATALLLLLGAKRNDSPIGIMQNTYDFILETKAGELLLDVLENNCNGLGSVFGRFREPERALKLVDCNPYTGKWNQHYFGNDWDVEEVVFRLEQELKRVLL